MPEPTGSLTPGEPPGRTKQKRERQARPPTGTADEMRLGLRRPAHRSPGARALHNLREAARRFRPRGQPREELEFGACENLIATRRSSRVSRAFHTFFRAAGAKGRDQVHKAREPDDKRTGTFTSGIVSLVGAWTIALFFTGWKHAGENIADVLKHRAHEQPAPIQMCDALSRNTPKGVETLIANCLAHYLDSCIIQSECEMDARAETGVG